MERRDFRVCNAPLPPPPLCGGFCWVPLFLRDLSFFVYPYYAACVAGAMSYLCGLCFPHRGAGVMMVGSNERALFLDSFVPLQVPASSFSYCKGLVWPVFWVVEIFGFFSAFPGGPWLLYGPAFSLLLSFSLKKPGLSPTEAPKRLGKYQEDAGSRPNYFSAPHFCNGGSH